MTARVEAEADEALPMTFFTVGHSNLPLDAFLAMLASVEIGCIVDVRRFPASRRNPQFNGDVLPDHLKRIGVDYVALASLGGRRPTRGADASPNDFWEHASFRAYADYAMTPAFAQGLADLRALGRATRPAVMCSEAVWWRCHRRIIADYLLAAGESVLHLMSAGKAVPASLTSAAVRDGAVLRYPKAGPAGDAAASGSA